MLCRSALRSSGTEDHTPYLPLPFDDPFGPCTFPAFDGPARCGIFPTDFSSTPPSADYPLAIADVAADPLRAFSQYRGFSRGTPGCFLCVTVESTIWSACLHLEAGNWDFKSVLPSRPASRHAYTHLRGVSPPVYTVRSAHIFVFRLPQGTVSRAPFAFDYPSCYLCMRLD